MAAMLIADPQYLAAYDLTPDMFQSFVGLAGPYHFTPTEEKYKTIFGPPDQYKNMQASHFIDGTEPPMLLLHGAEDTIVDTVNIDRISAAIHEHGGHVASKIYPDLGHIKIMGAFSNVVPVDAPVVADTVAFFNAHKLDASQLGKE